EAAINGSRGASAASRPPIDQHTATSAATAITARTRSSPAAGFRRLMPSRSGLDLVRAVIAVAALVAVCWSIGGRLAADAPRLPLMAASIAAARGWDAAARLLWQGGLVLLAVGAADYGVQRWRLTQALRMTKREV